MGKLEEELEWRRALKVGDPIMCGPWSREPWHTHIPWRSGTVTAVSKQRVSFKLMDAGSSTYRMDKAENYPYGQPRAPGIARPTLERQLAEVVGQLNEVIHSLLFDLDRDFREMERSYDRGLTVFQTREVIKATLILRIFITKESGRVSQLEEGRHLLTKLETLTARIESGEPNDAD